MIETKSLHPDKLEAIRKCENDPCGASRSLDPDSRAYLEWVEVERYEHYARWMRETFGFDRFPDKRVLEVGFGLGSDLMHFGRGGSEVYGVDLTPRHVELASRRFLAFGMQAYLVLGDAECLQYRSESFDVVYSFGVLHHTADMRAAVGEIYRVLRRGGIVFLVVYRRHSVPAAWKLVVEGILKGQLFVTDWRTLLSSLEGRPD